MHENTRSYSDDFGRLFALLARRRTAFMTAQLREQGLSSPMCLIICALSCFPGSSQDFLACHYSVDKATIARSAKRLEELGYISRSVNAGDRRQLDLSLTDRGRELYKAISGIQHDWTLSVTAGLEEDERLELRRILDKITELSRSLM